uniref:Leucine-rich repeat-containing protein 34 n=1 Tax=Syphacia muris TaxID=451379 RepID=A0A0N5AA97_9BILA
MFFVGQRLSQAHMECLEEILKRVQFDTLDFEYTFIDDDAAVSLAEMLEFYDSTVKLNLSFNKQISIRGWQAIFLAIKNCPSLQFLNLRYTSLSDRVVPVLTRTLRTQPSLTVLHIENVSLSGKGLLLLVSALKTNTILRELYLGENNLQPTDGSQLHQLIVGNSSIQILDLRNNQLQDAGAAHIFDALKNSDAIENSALSALVLWNNRLTSASMGALACGLMKNDRLETLNIGSNDLSVDGITALKPALLANTSLQRLGLQATGLDCECAIVLAECIADNKVLVRIDLRDNANIGSAGLLALHLAMKMNTSITLLDLDYSCTNSKVKEYDDEFRKYFSEIKEFCERNKKIALDKLTVQAELPKDGDDALSEEPECNLQLFEEEEEGEKKAPVENKVTGEEEKAGKSEEDKPLNRRPNGFGLNSTQRRRPVFKLTRSSSLTCAELVEDLSVSYFSALAFLTAIFLELVKSPSLPILVDRNLGNDAAVPVKRKPRRFSVSVVPTSSSNPDIYRSSSPRFKVSF